MTIVTTSQLADLIGKSPRTVEKYVKDGIPVHERGIGRGNENTFDSVEALDWIYGKGRLDYERMRLTALQADHEGLKILQRARDLAPVSAMEQILSVRCIAARQKFLGVASKLKTRYALEADLVRAIEELHNEALEELSADRLPTELREALERNVPGVEAPAEADA